MPITATSPDLDLTSEWVTFQTVRSAAGTVLVQKNADGCTRSVLVARRPARVQFA